MNDISEQDDSPEEELEEASSGRKRRRPLTNLQIILIALIVVGGRLVFDFSQRIIEGQEMLARQQQLETQIEALEAEQRELEAAKAYYSSRAYVEAWAHSQGKMVREGETLLVPLYDEDAPVVAPVNPPEAVAPQSAWMVWWGLFFDNPPPFEITPPQ